VTDAELAIIVVDVTARQVVRFQGILDGEDGLAALRCRDPAGNEQQLWTTRARLAELRSWLQGLPPSLQVNVIREEM